MSIFEETEDGQLKFARPIKAAEGIGCRVKFIEEEDGIVIQFISDSYTEGSGTDCIEKADFFNNVYGCKKVACTKSCKLRKMDNGEYNCECE